MLEFLKGDKEKKARSELDALRSRRVKMNSRLEAAEQQLALVRLVPIKLARDAANDATLAEAVERVRSAERFVENLRLALVEEDADVTSLEAEIAALADQAQRAQTSAEILSWVSEVEKLRAELESEEGFLTRLAKISDRSAIICTDARGVAAFCETARNDLLPATRLIAEILNAQARAAREGTGPATLPNRPQLPEQAKAAVIVSDKVYLTKPVKWTDPFTNGEKTWPAWHAVDLPADLASRALAIKVALRMDDPVARKALAKGGGHAFIWPDRDKCVSLDHPGQLDSHRSTQPPVLHSAFDPVDRGKPFIIKTAAGGAKPEGEVA
jgi:hypothetical protein